jgi:F-type H+-transporting ATPase subunit a
MRAPQGGEINIGEIVPHHTADAYSIDFYPLGKLEWHKWPDIHIGNFAINLTPTKHVVFLVIAAVLVFLVMKLAGMALARQRAGEKAPRGFAAAMEGLVLFVRDEIAIANIGHDGAKFAPLIMTLFFFILFANLLGLVPYGATATGNISVTATLAIVTFIVIEVAGMKAQGKAYLNTIIFWPHDMSLPMKLFISPILTPIEIFGKFTKPFALAIRLFANMVSGHVVLLALISLIFSFATWALVPVPIAMGLGISMLELFVAFLQAFIFTLLSSVFIGLIREGAH